MMPINRSAEAATAPPRADDRWLNRHHWPALMPAMSPPTGPAPASTRPGTPPAVAPTGRDGRADAATTTVRPVRPECLASLGAPADPSIALMTALGGACRGATCWLPALQHADGSWWHAGTHVPCRRQRMPRAETPR